MGTTATALQTEPGNQLATCAIIEGFPYVLTDHGDLNAVFAAWEESDWGEGSIAGQLSGLKVMGQKRESIEPWSDTIEAPRIRLVVQPDDNDTLGIAIWKTKPSFESRLASVFAPAANGTGTLTVKQTTYNSPPSAGTVYLGGKQVTYTSKTATEFTVSRANTYAPFSGDGSNYFSPGHGRPSADHFDAAMDPKVQDVPRTWIGKKVAVYLHRVVGGVLDTSTQALLWFAGEIKSVSEDDEGQTVIECEDLRGKIRDAVLFRKQWTGFVREGIRLVAGTKFRALQLRSSVPTTSADFEVMSSGASGSAQVDAGYYTIDELKRRLDNWLGNDSNLNGAVNSDGWYCKIKTGEGGSRFVVGAEFSTSDDTIIYLSCNDVFPMEFLGFDVSALHRVDGWYRANSGTEDTASPTLASAGPPYRFFPIQLTGQGGTSEGYSITLSGYEGEWFDHHAYLPSQMQGWAGTENYSTLLIGGRYCFGKFVSNTSLTNVLGISGTRRTGLRGEFPGVTVDDQTDRYEVKQVVMLAGSLSSLLPKLFASLDGAGTNHATHDVFPFGAGIPWSLLGSNFTDSLKSLEQTNNVDGMVIRLTKPTKLLDILLPELALRFAFLVWKDEGYQIITPPTPNSTTADWTLDETNKAGQPGQELRSISFITQEHLRNVVKVEYDRRIDGTYASTVYVKDQTSIDDYGESQAVTVKAANTYSEEEGSAAAIEDTLAAMAARSLPFWSKQLKVVRRSIPPTHYGMAPGDTVSLTDDFVRDPQTGVRGLSARGGIVLSVNHDWGSDGGQLFGEGEIVISDEDRTYPYSPCAQVDHTYTTGTFTAGYSDSTKQLKLVQHQHSRSSDAKDVTHFAAGDLVRIIQIDPADPASVTAWNRTIATNGVDGTSDTLEFTATLSSPAFNSALRYRVVPQSYTSVQTGQKDGAFIAGNADGLIQDTAQPNLYGEFKQTSYTNSALTVLPSLIPTEADDEGKPLHPGLAYDLGTMINNLVSYKCATSAPMIFGDSLSGTNTGFNVYLIFPFFCGGVFPPGFTRYIKCAPRFKTTGGTGYVRVTTSMVPPRGTRATPIWDGPRHHVEFTTTSTASGGVEVTAQDVRCVRGAHPGDTWITVELKATSGQTTTMFALSRLYLGPLEAL